jgi:transposase
VKAPSEAASTYAALTEKVEQLSALVAEQAKERDAYKQLYLEAMERCRKLELGLMQKRERFSTHDDAQMSLLVLSELLGEDKAAALLPLQSEPKTQVPAHERKKPTGRKPLPESLPRVEIEVLPPEVQEKGTEAFERIGEETSEVVERRPSSLVVVRTIRGKYRLRESSRTAEILQAEPEDLPIARGLAGPAMLAETVAQRWLFHMPLHRMERFFGREGLELARSTICGWHLELAKLSAPLIDAMWRDTRESPVVCTDATGVLVQAKDKCKNAHFFVVVAPERHVMFGYTTKHDSAAVDKLLAGYKGYLVADAHAVYDHLFKSGDVLEVACWAHARRYCFKALESDPARAKHALGLIQALFALERAAAKDPPDKRLAMRQRDSVKLLDAFFSWCRSEADLVLDDAPIQRAIGYALNQEEALRRFTTNASLPLHNNVSENALRREALGRKNWLFLGSDDGGEANATFVSLIASCQLHAIEPTAYLRDLFCLLPRWKKSELLDLAPARWKQTCEHQETHRLLADNVFRQVALGLRVPHTPSDTRKE